MAGKKLSQKEIMDNWDAVKTFISLCEIESDNGNIILFKAQGIYIDKTHGKGIDIPRCRMFYGTDKYGGMTLTISGIDPNCYFCEISTAFSKFKFENGRLIISGKDSWGTGKGDYEIQMHP